MLGSLLVHDTLFCELLIGLYFQWFFMQCEELFKCLVYLQFLHTHTQKIHYKFVSKIIACVFF